MWLQELAVPVFGDEHFAVSAHLLLGAMGNGVSQQAQPPKVEDETGVSVQP